MKDFPKLLNGDFFQGYHNIPEKSVDLILTDPPFGILRQLYAWDKFPDLVALEISCDYLLKNNGRFISFCDLHRLRDFLNTFNNCFQYHFYHIWSKTGGIPSSPNRLINDSEFILVFRRKGALEKDLTVNPKAMGDCGEPYFKNNSSPDIPTRKQKKSKQHRNLSGKRFPKTIIEAPGKPNMKADERSIHPTQKPELLLRKLIRGYSNPGDMILDPFAGSGSSLISAYRENRKSKGYEIEKNYYLEAKQRIKNVTCQIEMLL